MSALVKLSPSAQAVAARDMLAQVADEADDAVGGKPPMAPLEYTLTTTLPAGSSTKPADCRYTGSGLTKAPARAATAGGGAAADREGQAVPSGQLRRGRLVVHRKGGDSDALLPSVAWLARWMARPQQPRQDHA